LSEQAIVAPVAVVPDASTMPAATSGAPAELENRRARRPNRGQSHWNKRGAPERVQELLGEIKNLKHQLAEAQTALDSPDPETERLRTELEKLRGEMLDVLSENAELKGREEQRLWAQDEDAKNAKQVADDHRLLCFRALVDVSHQTGAYTRHPDFDTRMKRAEQSFSTSLLESILCFPPAMAPELAYSVASTPGAALKLSSLPPSAQVFWLVKLNGEFEEKLKWANLSNVR
jgi:seryl-tRNA synthetase